MKIDANFFAACSSEIKFYYQIGNEKAKNIG
jgi:hypothetical protein